MLSQRVNNIKESGIRKVFALAANNTGEYVNLSIGQPHFCASDRLKRSAIKAIENNCNTYVPTKGLPKLIESIAGKLNVENGIPAEPEEIIVTAGVSGAIFLLLSAIIDPGDEVILPDPYFVLYKEVLTFLGAKIVFLDTYPDFHIDPDRLAALISPKTKAIIINSPGNPTGAVLAKDQLQHIADVASAGNILVISDEIYEKFDYDQRFASIGSFYPNTVTLNGYSKSHAIPGWRMGYAHGPAEIIEAMNKLQQYTFVCAPSFAQMALASEEGCDPEGIVEEYRKKRDYVHAELKDHYKMVKPEGAFYAFIQAPEGREDFCDVLIEKKLLAVPGKVFSQRGDHFRISFAADDEVLRKGIEILKKAA